MVEAKAKYKYLTEERRAKIDKVIAGRQQGVVVLEDIYDPHNAMAVMRSCDAFGIQDIYVINASVKKFNPRKVGKQTSSSANKWLNFHCFDTTEDCLKELKSQGYTIVATVLDDESKPIHEVDFTAEAKIALMFGNEHAGLTQEALAMSDIKINIPMTGMVQSLNLSVTAAISVYEMTRQRRAKGMQDFSFDEAAREKLLEDFTKR